MREILHQVHKAWEAVKDFAEDLVDDDDGGSGQLVLEVGSVSG